MADFQKFMRAALQTPGLKNMPKELCDQIEKGLLGKYNKPPMEGIMLTLQRQVTLEEAQRMLFAPTVEDTVYYQTFIRGAPDGAPKEHPQNSLQRVSIITLYTHHVYKWSFVEPFILSGGLSALGSMVAHPDLHLRSQCLETFLNITDEEMFEWHKQDPAREDPKAASTSSGGAAAGGSPEDAEEVERGRRLRTCMYRLANTRFLAHLLANAQGSYPRGSYDALRSFAFFVSFVRVHYTPNGVLILGKEILDQLAAWPKTDINEEKMLAEQLYEDFVRFSSEEDAPTAGSQATGEKPLSIMPPPEDGATPEEDVAAVRQDLADMSVGPSEGGSAPAPPAPSSSAPPAAPRPTDAAPVPAAGDTGLFEGTSVPEFSVEELPGGEVEVRVPGIQSASGLDAHVSEEGLLLEVEVEGEVLVVPLPRRVLPDSCRAKFSKKTKTLTVKMGPAN